VLRNKQRKFIFSLIGERAQLDTVHLSANVSGQLCDLGSFQEVWKGRVGVFAVLVVLEWL
jgi:hypothetical protein